MPIDEADMLFWLWRNKQHNVNTVEKEMENFRMQEIDRAMITDPLEAKRLLDLEVIKETNEKKLQWLQEQKKEENQE